MQVVVRDEHIEAAREACTVDTVLETCCPIAQALREQRPDLEWHVLYKGWPKGHYENEHIPLVGWVVGTYDGKEMEHYALSQRAALEAYYFDFAGDFVPARFRLRPTDKSPF